MDFTLPLFQGRTLASGPFPCVMAILNVTPDSFSDGGRFATAEDAVAEGMRFAQMGASIVDIGGESTRPRGSAYGQGAEGISANEEERRVLPVLSSLRRNLPSIPISVDTRRVEIARAALDAGADLINVVTGLDISEDLLELVSSRGAALVLNHCRGTPSSTFNESSFTDVLADVSADLNAARARALSFGISGRKILLDPGLGFGKTPEQNFALLGALERLAAPGVPLVVGASRKAFLGTVAGAAVHERLPESLAAVALCLPASARGLVVVRVHEVAETVRFLSALALARSARSARPAGASPVT